MAPSLTKPEPGLLSPPPESPLRASRRARKAFVDARYREGDRLTAWGRRRPRAVAPPSPAESRSPSRPSPREPRPRRPRQRLRLLVGRRGDDRECEPRRHGRQPETCQPGPSSRPTGWRSTVSQSPGPTSTTRSPREPRGAGSTRASSGCRDPTGVAVDGRTSLDDLQRHDRPRQARRQRRQPGLITGVGCPQGIAVDDTHIYWGTDAAHRRARQPRRQRRRTGLHPRRPPRRPHRQGVAVDSTSVYWSDDNTIGRANLDGTGIDAGLHHRRQHAGGSRSTASTSTGRTYDARSGEPTSNARASTRISPAPTSPYGGGRAGRRLRRSARRRSSAPAARNRLTGTSGKDVVAANAGNDRVIGLRGDDIVCGAGGDDELAAPAATTSSGAVAATTSSGRSRLGQVSGGRGSDSSIAAERRGTPTR